MPRTAPGCAFAYLERDADADMYQGHNYTRVYVEEVGNFPSPAPVMKLMATLRSGAGVPVDLRATGNPGGPGHQWVKARYIDPAPLGNRIIRDPVTGLERVFIPSLEPYGLLILISLLFILPMLGAQMGVDVNICLAVHRTLH